MEVCFGAINLFTTTDSDFKSIQYSGRKSPLSDERVNDCLFNDSFIMEGKSSKTGPSYDSLLLQTGSR